jgi:hypothetical protein
MGHGDRDKRGSFSFGTWIVPNGIVTNVDRSLLGPG